MDMGRHEQLYDIKESFFCKENSIKNLISYKYAIDRVAIVAYTDKSGSIIDVNDLFCQISQYSKDDLIGKNHRIINSGYHPPAFFREMWRTISAGEIWRGELCNRTKSGSHYWVDTVIVPEKGADGKISGYVSVRLDITARKQAEARAAEENRKRMSMEGLLDDVIDALPNGVIAYDEAGHILFFNKAHKEIYNDLTPLAFEARRDSASSEKQGINVDGVRAGLVLGPNEGNLKPIVQQLPDDRWVQIQNRISQAGTLVSVQTDVTPLKRAENQIKHQAERDALTGAYNRHALFSHLSQRCRNAGGDNQHFTLVLVDLNGFKAINDRLGHDAGDALLIEVAGNFQTVLRRTDVLARLGGDEFAILLPDTHEETDIGQVMDKLTRALSKPIKIGQRTISCAASMGVAVYPRDGKNPKEIIKSADVALYHCKRSGHEEYTVYSTSMHRQQKRRSLLIDKLRDALGNNDLGVVVQPQLDMTNGRHIGFESLVRWKAGRRWVPPLELISIAEEAGLVTQLSQQVMDKALGIANRMKSMGHEPGIIAFNVVAAQLHKPDFAESLMCLLDKHHILPNEIEIEVTENVILDRSAGDIARVLHGLHAKGMSIALDDFGTGYASLTHLKQFPLDRLKIDRSFVSGLMADKDDHVIVRTIISLAHSLGLKVVAEGIETRAQYQELSNLGCDYAQGYLIGRPMPEDTIQTYFESHSNATGESDLWARRVSKVAGKGIHNEE